MASISIEELKEDDMIEKLNQNGYTAYAKDTKGINNGYPILEWQ